MERDFEARPYTEAEKRVVDFIQTIAPEIGGGDDPLGFILSSYAMLSEQRAKMRTAIHTECHRLEHDWNEADVALARRNLLQSLSSAI